MRASDSLAMETSSEAANAGNRDILRPGCAEHFDIARDTALAGFDRGPTGSGQIRLFGLSFVLHRTISLALPAGSSVSGLKYQRQIRNECYPEDAFDCPLSLGELR
jgi:hypothetical protein